MANVSSFSGAMPVIPGGLVELGYSAITSSVTVNNATAGTGTEVIAPLTVLCDGGPVLVECYIPGFIPSTTLNDQISGSLFYDGSEQSRYWFYARNTATGNYTAPVHAQYRMTPTAGSHTFGLKAFVTNAARTGTVSCGTGSTGDAPAFLRVSKILQPNNGLKPFWTPPIVTQLPANPSVGDQVVNYTTNGAYQPYFYTGATDGWKQVGTSKPPMCVLTIGSGLGSGGVSVGNTAVTLGNASTTGTYTEEIDTDAMHDASVNPTRITVNTAGVYLISAVVAGNGTSEFYSVFKKNGTDAIYNTAAAAGSYNASMTPSFVNKLSVGDYFELAVSSVTTRTYAARFAATWIGPAS